METLKVLLLLLCLITTNECQAVSTPSEAGSCPTALLKSCGPEDCQCQVQHCQESNTTVWNIHMYDCQRPNWTLVKETITDPTSPVMLLFHSTNVTIIPEWICQLEQLQNFSMINCNLHEVPKDCLQNSVRLQKIDLRQNFLKYFNPNLIKKGLNSLDLSYNQIKYLPLEFWQKLNQFQVNDVHLHSNLLTHLPEELLKENYNFPLSLSLKDNPYWCNCSSLEFKKWIQQHHQRLNEYDDIACLQPYGTFSKSLLLLPDKFFKCGSSWSRAHDMFIGAIVFLIVGTTVAISICCVLWHKKKNVYHKFHFHPFDNDECEGEEMEFDVYVNNCTDTENWVETYMLPVLAKKKYQVFYPKERFSILQHNPALDCTEALEKSKRRLCIISSAFKDDQECCKALTRSLELDRTAGYRRTILVLYDLNTPIPACVPCELVEHIKTYKPLDGHAKNFLSTLLYRLTTDRCREQHHSSKQDEVPLI